MNELALFAGAGGGILGGKLLGWRTICAVEYDEHARKVLMSRQDDGCLDPFPIWDDIRTFDGKPWRGRVDVVSGGFPCQDISIAGRGDGLEGERSGLWVEMARVIRQVVPRYVFVENSPMLAVRGLGKVLGDLAEMGYDAAWGVLGAADASLPHKRDRIWVVAHSNDIRRDHSRIDATGRRLDAARKVWQAPQISSGWPHRFDGTFPANYLNDWTIPETGSVRGIDGVADWMDRIARVGNGQVPQVAAIAWEILTSNHSKNEK